MLAGGSHAREAGRREEVSGKDVLLPRRTDGAFRALGEGAVQVTRKVRQPTIRDVARRAQTSTATVSRVLNETGFVSEALRERVLKAAAELGYTPNSLARSLKSQSTHTVGVLITDITNQFYASLVRGLEDVLSQRGYHALLSNTDYDVAKEAEHCRLMCEKRVEGVIISAAGQETAHLRRLRDQGIPWVFVNRRPKGCGGLAILTDNRAGAFEATLHLVHLGHRRIGVVAGPQDINTGIDRLQGYREAMAVAGLPVREEWIVPGYFREDGGYQAAVQLLDLPRDRRPTALFVCNNKMTVGVWNALADRKVRVPDEMALVGFDESEWARMVRPPLTTVAQRTYEMGQAAARRLLQAISRGRDAFAPTVASDLYLKPQLIVRQSCGSNSAEDTPQAAGGDR